MVETFTNSRAEEVRSLRLDVFYPHLNLIPETSHLSILVISRNSSEGRISSNRGSPRISHHLFKTLFRFPVPPRFPLKRSKKKGKNPVSLSQYSNLCRGSRRSDGNGGAVDTWRCDAFAHRCFRRVDWPRFIRRVTGKAKLVREIWIIGR